MAISTPLAALFVAPDVLLAVRLSGLGRLAILWIGSLGIVSQQLRGRRMHQSTTPGTRRRMVGIR
jgi:hypothetical protein